MIQNRQIDRHLTELREIKEDEAGATIASLGQPRRDLRLADANAHAAFALGQLPSSTAEAFAADLQALAPKKITLYADGFAAFGSHDGSTGDSGYDYTQPGLTVGLDYQVH